MPAERDDERNLVALHCRRDDGGIDLMVVPAVVLRVKVFVAALGDIDSGHWA